MERNKETAEEQTLEWKKKRQQQKSGRYEWRQTRKQKSKDWSGNK